MKSISSKSSRRELSEEQINDIIGLTARQKDCFIAVIRHYVHKNHLDDFDRLTHDELCAILHSMPEQIMTMISITAEEIEAIIQEILDEDGYIDREGNEYILDDPDENDFAAIDNATAG